MAKAPDERSALKAYIDACLVWPKKFANEAHFWGQFQSLCLINPIFLRLHQEVASIGQQRIQAMLTGIGIEAKKTIGLSIGIQAMITGAIWTIGLDRKADAQLLRDQILRSVPA